MLDINTYKYNFDARSRGSQTCERGTEVVFKRLTFGFDDVIRQLSKSSTGEDLKLFAISNFEQLDFKDQRGVRGDLVADLSLAVSELRRYAYSAKTTGFHI